MNGSTEHLAGEQGVRPRVQMSQSAMVQASLDGPFTDPPDDDECDCERADCPTCTARNRQANKEATP